MAAVLEVAGFLFAALVLVVVPLFGVCACILAGRGTRREEEQR